MTILPEFEEQVRRTHAQLIHLVVKACLNPPFKTELEPVLRTAKNNGWESLTDTVHQILAGRRDESLLQGLDKEDQVITKAILLGLQNPHTLPPLTQQADPTVAAPGLAHMIHAAGRGDAQALQSLGFMAEQMIHTSGDLRLLGGIMNRLIKGERNPDTLSKGMSANGEQLLLSLLEELNKLNMQ
jgi:hypothetical protein